MNDFFEVEKPIKIIASEVMKEELLAVNNPCWAEFEFIPMKKRKQRASISGCTIAISACC